MVGREKELQTIEQALMEVSQGHGEVVTITGEAGVGKSRFVAEVIRSSEEMHFKIHGSACQSYGTSINYLVWQAIYRELFGLNPCCSKEQQVQTLKRKLEEVNPMFVARMPLLGNMLGLTIPDNELTRSMNAKLRKVSIEALLVEYIKFKAQENPLLLVLDDCHWIDDLSRDLVTNKGRLVEPTLGLLHDAGLVFEEHDRSLVARVQNHRLDILFVRTGDIIEFVGDGVADLGVTGIDLLAEAGSDLPRVRSLGHGHCRLEAAVPAGSPCRAVEDLAGLRVATAHPNTTRRFFEDRRIPIEVIALSGAVEVAPRLGLAEAIVDLVSTGSTLVMNGLRPIGDVLASEAVLVANPGTGISMNRSKPFFSRPACAAYGSDS